MAYGDYDLALGGHIAAGAMATAVVYFVDGAGSPGKVVATSPITPASPPDPFASDPHPVGWNCTQ
jgi:hypothetical protein